jgi:hypothetical protein
MPEKVLTSEDLKGYLERRYRLLLSEAAEIAKILGFKPKPE